jgi:two-component sensor histidine kinase
VKNNLQTISSLLRLQGRRLESPEAKAAIEESVRRVRSISLVHEILSREAGEDVRFLDIVGDLTRMAQESFAVPDRPIRCTIKGDPGVVPAAVATPLAVVLNELLQNTADHAFPAGGGGGTVVLRLRRDPELLVIDVADDGVGISPDFNIDESTGLGLSIVRTLVGSELDGTIRLRPVDPPGRGTVAEIRVPLL